jgi:hypothetical protein
MKRLHLIEACNKAFALACRYSGGCDLVEEILPLGSGPLGSLGLRSK